MSPSLLPVTVSWAWLGGYGMFALRGLLLLGGLLCLCIAFLLFPDDRKILVSRLEILWINIDERSKDSQAWSTAFLQTIARASEGVLGRLFGLKNFSFTSVLLSLTYSLTGYWIAVLIELRFLGALGLLRRIDVCLWVINVLLAAIVVMVPTQRTRLRLVLLLGTLPVDVFYVLKFWKVGGNLVWAPVAGIALSVFCDFFFIGLNRKALAWCARQGGTSQILAVVALNCILALGTCVGPALALRAVMPDPLAKDLSAEFESADIIDRTSFDQAGELCSTDRDLCRHTIDSFVHAQIHYAIGDGDLVCWKACHEAVEIRRGLCAKSPKCSAAMKRFEAVLGRIRVASLISGLVGGLVFANLDVVLASCVVILIMLLMFVHKLTWPFVSRVVYALNSFEVLKNTKLMGGLGAAMILAALPDGTIKSVLTTIFKL